MLTCKVTVQNSGGTERQFTVREMTVGEIGKKTPDIELIRGMCSPPEAAQGLEDLPMSEFKKLVAAVIELTYGTAASAKN